MARKSTRKRERGDHSLEPNKREHSDNTEERYMEPTVHLEEMEEVVDLTDKATGGLAFPAGVIKIMDIMQTVTLDNEAGAHAAEIILSKRAVLAQIVASTSRADCARLFLKEGGLDQLQDWLREAMQAAIDFPSCRAQTELLLIALLIAIERLREHPDRLREETLKVVQVLSEPEGQLSNAVKLRAKRLCSSWGEARRRGARWGGGESSASGADIFVESKDDTSPSTSAERDESTEAVSSRGAHLLHKPGGGPGEGVEEVAGIMRLTMNSPGAGAAAQAPSGRFETAPEESSSGGEREVALELEGG